MENTPSCHCSKHVIKNIIKLTQAKSEYKLAQLNTAAHRHCGQKNRPKRTSPKRIRQDKSKREKQHDII